MADNNLIEVTLDQQGSINLSAVPGALAEAIQAGAEYIQSAWIAAAMNGLNGIPPTHDEAYIWGIQSGMDYPYAGDPFHARVANFAPSAQRVEEGFASFDMKPGFLAGHQARRANDGTRYNIIPFRWGTPREGDNEAGSGGDRATLKAMPESIFDLVKDFRQSRRTGHHDVESVNRNAPAHVKRLDSASAPAYAYENEAGAMRRVYEYQWGDQLRPEDIPGRYAVVAQPWHKTSMFAGMYRFAADDGTMKKHSHYMTFRAVSDKSSPQSWIHPGAKGKPFSKAVLDAEAENVKRLVRDMVAEAVGGGT